MKAVLLCLLGIWALVVPAWAQLDTTGGQFYQPIYPSVTITRDVPFGSAVNAQGATQTLLMDVYEPATGPATPRPLIIMAHGGAFLFGSRNDYDVSELCTRFARLGYVTASIDYRLEPSIFTYSGARAVVHAVHDMRAAVRYFRQSADATNPFRIDPQYIFAGGSSAGAITALHTAFLDKDAELASINAGVPGGLEGNSGSPGYSSAIRAAINLCGALGNPVWIETGDEPFVSLHGTNDAVVPYNSGVTFGSMLYGSGALKPRADAVSVPNTLYRFSKAGHVPYNGTSAAQLAYMDTTYWTVRTFLRPLLAQPGTTLPVTLTRFEARRQGTDALLQWETATEQNSLGYEVQVSTDGHSYRRVSFVNSQGGETSGPRRYQYRDAETSKHGLRYYRLRQLDNDGKATFYGPRTVSFKAAQSALSVYPNPVRTTLFIEVQGPATQPNVRLQLHNAQGQQVAEQLLVVGTGAARMTYQIPAGLPPGLYTLTLQHGTERQHIKLQKVAD